MTEPGAPQVTSPDLVRKPGERFYFIDLFRFIAVFLMVQGHVFRALISWDLTKSVFWQVHETVHKLTAPMFLFGAGMIFMVITRGRWDTYMRFDGRTWKRVRRYIYFLLIGYWLHLPYMSLAHIIRDMGPELLARMTLVDVLHIISIGLILLQLMCMALRRAERMWWVLLPLSVVCFAAAPFVVPLKLSGPSPLVSWITTQYASRFTIIPWWGYLYFGAAMGTLFPTTGRLKDERRFIAIVMAAGALLLSAGLAISIIQKTNFVYGRSYAYDQTLARLGGAMLILGLCWFMEKWGIARKMKKVFFLSEESLIAYVFHLLVTYGSVLAPGLSRFFGNQLGIGWLVLAFIGVAAVTVPFTYLWHWLKKKHFNVLRIIQAAMVILFLLLFSILPN